MVLPCWYMWHIPTTLFCVRTDLVGKGQYSYGDLFIKMKLELKATLKAMNNITQCNISYQEFDQTPKEITPKMRNQLDLLVFIVSFIVFYTKYSAERDLNFRNKKQNCTYIYTVKILLFIHSHNLAFLHCPKRHHTKRFTRKLELWIINCFLILH